MALKLLIISSYKDTWNSVRPEAEIFIGMAKLGVDVTLMTQGDAEYVPRFREHGVKIIDYHPTKKFQWSAIKRIRSELKLGGYDAVYMFNNKAITNALFAAIGLPAKMVSYRGQTGNIYRYDPTCYLTHLHPRLDGIICVANAVRDDLRQYAYVADDKVVTVYKGHSLDWYQDKPVDLAEFNIPADAFVVGCVANARPRKGLPVLIEATHKLPENSDIHILLVGGGMDTPEVRQLIDASPMADRIHLAGFRRDAPAIIAACNVSALPSTKREGLPKTVIEAMVYEVAPVVADTGGSAELVVDGDSGLVVPPGDSQALADAIAKLWHDPTFCKQMGIRAKQRITEHFHTDLAALQTKEYFEKLIDKA
ncbi:glycosyltransferase family 4 protein [Corallincola spongiicola]|uniref:Glycosyltransferase family 1 protein n=1 Tax=Corallincola spongiicola TaxID=2520508 RepID=A0ABY1WPT8_9GAMM|nr:glycosyltransferase family 4 protein [Corallincola spongiicola]TAA46012.1 glycosyltransferase family 1 protein [Corallincola spongiicola]